MSDDTSPIVDLSYLNEYTDGDEDILNELLEAFAETVNEEMQKLKIATEEKDHKIWRTAAHTLKGAAGFVGAQKMKDVCARAQELETMDTAQNKSYLNEIQHTYDAVYTVLKDTKL